jgi:hypothetical protein
MAITLIPTSCPRFVAACIVCGVDLAKGTPGVSNTYSKNRKYDPEEPGDVHFYLDNQQGINPLALAKVWSNPDPELVEAAAIKGRLVACKSPDEWNQIADDIETLHVTGAIATIRQFERGRFPIDSKIVSDQEEEAARVMAGFSSKMKAAKARNGAAFASRFEAAWQPAMFAWTKAWIAQYLELRNVWQSAGKSVKIEREGRFPLVIPRGKDFAKLMRRWT